MRLTPHERVQRRTAGQIIDVPRDTSRGREREKLSKCPRPNLAANTGAVSAFGRLQETESEDAVSAWNDLHCRHLLCVSTHVGTRQGRFGMSEFLKGVVNRSWKVPVPEVAEQFVARPPEHFHGCARASDFEKKSRLRLWVYLSKFLI